MNITVGKLNRSQYCSRTSQKPRHIQNYRMSTKYLFSIHNFKRYFKLFRIAVERLRTSRYSEFQFGNQVLPLMEDFRSKYLNTELQKNDFYTHMWDYR